MQLSDYLCASADLLSSSATSERDEAVERALDLLMSSLVSRRPVLVCGNGGSAADALHLAAELTGRFRRDRKALSVLPLVGNPAFLTGWMNDVDADSVFERQVEAHGSAGGILIALSTSGRSPSVLRAAAKARDMKLGVIAFTGQLPNPLATFADVTLDVPSVDTALIQQAHLCYYHYLCSRVEDEIISGA